MDNECPREVLRFRQMNHEPLVADGALVVPVAGVYPLEHIQDAVQHLLRGGKILLKVAGR
jgi:hypothetical protein